VGKISTALIERRVDKITRAWKPLKKHYAGQHDQKDHGNWAHDDGTLTPEQKRTAIMLRQKRAREKAKAEKEKGQKAKSDADYKRAKRRAKLRQEAADRRAAKERQKKIKENADLINRRLRAEYRKYTPKKTDGAKKTANLASKRKLAQSFASYLRGGRKTDPSKAFTDVLTRREIKSVTSGVKRVFTWGSQVERLPARGSITPDSVRLQQPVGGGYVKVPGLPKTMVSGEKQPSMGKYKFVPPKFVDAGDAGRLGAVDQP